MKIILFTSWKENTVEYALKYVWQMILSNNNHRNCPGIIIQLFAIRIKDLKLCVASKTPYGIQLTYILTTL